MDLKQKLLDTLAPLIRIILKPLLEYLFDLMIKKNDIHGKVVLTSIYPAIDVELESIVEKTDSEVDDAIVDSLKESIEIVAKRYNIELVNLDED